MGLYIIAIQVSGPPWFNRDNDLQHNRSRGIHMKPNGVARGDNDGRKRKVRSLRKFRLSRFHLECICISVSACAGASSPIT
jgi:hypothetical protein